MPLDPRLETILNFVGARQSEPLPAVEFQEAKDIAKKLVMPLKLSAVGSVVSNLVPVETGMVVRKYTPQQARDTDECIVYIHGGGFVLYDLEVFGSLCEHIADATSKTVIALEYVKQPYADYPDTVSMLGQTLIELEQMGTLVLDKTTLSGDSVGGFLSLHLCHTLYERTKRRVRKLVLIYPVLDFDAEPHSYDKYGKDYFLDREVMQWFAALYRKDNPYHDTFKPLKLDHSIRLPETIVATVEFDILRDEAFEFVELLRWQGVKVTHIHDERLTHNALLVAGAVPAAKEFLDQILSTVK